MTCLGTTPNRQVKKNSLTLSIFLVLFGSALLAEFYCTFQFTWLPGIFANLLSVVICLISLATAAGSDPGYLKKSEIDFMKLLESMDNI